MAAAQKEVVAKIARAPSKTKATKPKVVKIDAPAFRDHETGKEIKGLPAPMPCPFCKRTDCTIITRGDKDDPSYIVECSYCGSEAPHAQTKLEAAQLWNGALGGVENRSAAEKIVGSALAHRHSFDSLSMRARAVLLRGLKTVLDNSNTDEEFEEATALSALLIDDLEGAADAVLKPKKKQFTDALDGQPIEGLPEPKPCPFCGFHEWTAIVTREACTTPEGIECEASYHIQCDGCFAEGSPKSTKLEAAQHWNKASTVDYSIIECADYVNLLLQHLSDMLVLAMGQLREHGVDIDQPIATCLEAALDAKLEPAREQFEKILRRLGNPRALDTQPGAG
jgi:hypothetical protein